MFSIAITSISNPLLLIKNNKVIGEVSGYIGMGYEYVSIILKDDDTKKLIPETHPLIEAWGYKHTSIRYNPITGEFIGFAWLDEEQELLNVFEDTLIVDKFNFEFGNVPDVFKSVVGYGTSLKNSV